MNTSTPERFPNLSIFGLTWLAFYLAVSAVFLWLSPLPTTPVIGLTTARLFVVVGLPSTSTVPVAVEGSFYPAHKYLGLQKMEPRMQGAADLLLYVFLPVTAVLAGLSVFFSRKWRASRPPKLVRGVQVLKR